MNVASFDEICSVSVSNYYMHDAIQLKLFWNCDPGSECRQRSYDCFC